MEKGQGQREKTSTAGASSHDAPLGEACPSEERGAYCRRRVPDYAVGKPRKSAKWAGTPKSVMRTGRSVGCRVLRIKRCAQESRACERWERDRMVGTGAARL